eukprot:UN23084
MNRTKLKRPLCTNVFSPEFAKAFALSTTMIGSTTLYHFCGPVSLALGLSTLGLYNIVYTPMINNSIHGNCSSTEWQNGAEKLSIGVQMQRLGYRTGYFGKYLNAYGSPSAGGVEHVPPGWNTWLGLKGNSVYYNYVLSNNGVAEQHGNNYEKDYLTDV